MKKRERIQQEMFDTVNAEFWLQQDDGLAEDWSDLVRKFLNESTDAEIRRMHKEYSDWEAPPK